MDKWNSKAKTQLIWAGKKDKIKRAEIILRNGARQNQTKATDNKFLMKGKNKDVFRVQVVPKNAQPKPRSISIKDGQFLATRSIWWLGFDHLMLMDHISECAFCLGHPVEEYNVVTSFEMTDILLTQTKQQQSVERENVPECCKKGTIT